MTAPPTGAPDWQRALSETVRADGALILATLVRAVGDLAVAEDAVQEAAVRALRDWPRTGIPAQPRAWLMVTARRVAIDHLRRESRRRDKELASMELTGPDLPPDSVIRDDQLRLIFTCAHPALSLESQVTLALRTLCGLSPRQIAAVLLSTDTAVAKRLQRTRAKIAQAGIAYRIPADHELPERLTSVCAVLHASYTAAHSAVGGAQLSDVDGCREAVRMTRLVCALLPDEPSPKAVLALQLFTEARRAARMTAAGDPVPLAEQDRTLWDRDSIEQARDLLAVSLRRTEGLADAYQLQAAIAAEHARAPSYEGTAWPEIVRLYDLLLSVQASAPAALARAVAVAEAHGPQRGLQALDGITRDQRWYAVRGELLARRGDFADAVAATRESLDDTVSAPERRYRDRRIAQWSSVPSLD